MSYTITGSEANVSVMHALLRVLLRQCVWHEEPPIGQPMTKKSIVACDKKDPFILVSYCSTVLESEAINLFHPRVLTSCTATISCPVCNRVSSSWHSPSFLASLLPHSANLGRSLVVHRSRLARKCHALPQRTHLCGFGFAHEERWGSAVFTAVRGRGRRWVRAGGLVDA